MVFSAFGGCNLAHVDVRERKSVTNVRS